MGKTQAAGQTTSLIGQCSSKLRDRYNQGILRHSLSIVLLLLMGMVLPRAALASTPAASQTLIILPFENVSKTPGLEWVGEAFPEVLGQRLASPSLYVISREERTYAFDRMGVPANLRPSRATLFRIAEQMDVDYMVIGEYSFDGQSFTSAAQLLDMKRLHLSPEAREAGPLPKMLEIQNALAWQLLRGLTPGTEVSRENFLAAAPEIRLDAFENYIRGVVAVARADKVRYFREAVRLSPSYTQAMLELGRTYFANREYESAASWFARVPKTEDAGREANFYLGLSAYYVGQYDRAASAFNFLLSRLPLMEVYNNLGVVESRRGRKPVAIEYFQKVVQADPNDPDYHFNLAVALYRNAEQANAVRQLQETLKLRPADTESKTLLEAIHANGVPAHPNEPSPAHVKVPLERIKRNYDETSFRQLALEIQRTTEERLAKAPADKHAAYHVEHGRELLTKGFVVEAKQEFREAVVLDPTNAGAHTGLALALEQANDVAAARSEARTAIQLQPAMEAYLVLARLDLRDNNLQSASDSVERALALEPDNPAALSLRRTVAAKLAQKAPPLQRK